MIVMIALGLVPVALVFLLLGYFAACIAKKRGKNPWLWGTVSVVVLTALSWQQLPKWAGFFTAYEMYALHTIMSLREDKLADPNAVVSFTLPPRTRATQYVPDLPQNAYTFKIPARYRAESPFPELVRMMCKYPLMEASPGSTLKERVIRINIGTDLGHMKRPQSFLRDAAKDKRSGEYISKQGNYDIYERKSSSTGSVFKKWLFTAKDGQPVLVEEGVMDSREVWHDIGNDMVVNYLYDWTKVGNDYIKIDEVVMDFVKAHLTSQPIQNRGQ